MIIIYIFLERCEEQVTDFKDVQLKQVDNKKRINYRKNLKN